jgi:hypothetical protein
MVKKPVIGFHDFRDVDRGERPESFVKYLDTVTGLELPRLTNNDLTTC